VVGRDEKAVVAQQLGAHVVISKESQELWPEARRASPGGYEVIFDANGVATLKDSYDHLAPTGRLVVYGFHSMMPRRGGRPNWFRLGWDYLRTPRFNPLTLSHENKSVMGFNLSYLFERLELLHDGLEQLSAWVEEGQFVAPPIQTYALEDVARAHADIESGATVGKLVLLP
jgi:NADPH:quinone reductase-like Zn-dependent oxidoreductase